MKEPRGFYLRGFFVADSGGDWFSGQREPQVLPLALLAQDDIR
jgi:hypothetical protein